jgi:hypothetical protein
MKYCYLFPLEKSRYYPYKYMIYFIMSKVVYKVTCKEIFHFHLYK